KHRPHKRTVRAGVCTSATADGFRERGGVFLRAQRGTAGPQQEGLGVEEAGRGSGRQEKALGGADGGERRRRRAERLRRRSSRRLLLRQREGVLRSGR
ncbi:unnamed protein product, partial [Ectocarpus sp. 13 AM-2016]